MAINEQQRELSLKNASEEVAATQAATSSARYAYRSGTPQPHRVDVLEQLRSNIQQIEDLQGRLSFLLREVRSVMKKG